MRNCEHIFPAHNHYMLNRKNCFKKIVHSETLVCIKQILFFSYFLPSYLQKEIKIEIGEGVDYSAVELNNYIK